ncbi:MAG: DUF1007 family protein [Alphaproteobacteria bacterium]|nr:DUF1007 family protein [Alphaproteobacteria bacterium]
MTRRGRSIVAACIVLMAALGTRPAESHPHVWITATATLVFEGDRIVGVRQEWLFDQIFSGNIIHDFDKNKDGKFDAKETAEVEKNAFGNLGQYDFFTHITVDKTKLSFKSARDFSIERQKDRVIYRFTLDLPKPIEPLKQGISLAIYDDTYFVEIMLAETDPVRFKGAKGVACHIKINRDESLATAYGVGTLEKVELMCGGAE